MEAQWEGKSLKGEIYAAHYRSAFSKKASQCATHQSLQMSQVTSAAHFTSLHLAHVGCGSLNKGDMNAPHLRPSTPGKVTVLAA